MPAWWPGVVGGQVGRGVGGRLATEAGCSAVGSAPDWGSGGRRFEPGHPDVKTNTLSRTLGAIAVHRHTLWAAARGLLCFVPAIAVPTALGLFGLVPGPTAVAMAVVAYGAVLVPVHRMIGRAGARDRAVLIERLIEATPGLTEREAIRRLFRP